MGALEPLVLLHGVGSSHRIWEPIAPHLASRHELIALDLPGFGARAPEPGVEPSVPSLAAAVERELDERGHETAHVLGNSMGGWIAIELGRRGRARSVVALSPTGGAVGLEATYARLSLRAHRIASRLLLPYAPALMARPRLRALLVWTMFARGERLPAELAVAATHDYVHAPSFDAMVAWMGANVLEGPLELGCPVTIAWGTRDRLLLPRQGPRIAAQIPGARLVPLPGLGHAPMVDDPDRVAELVLEVTARAGGGRSPEAEAELAT